MDKKDGQAPQQGGGASRRSVHFTDLRSAAQQSSINIDKYRPATEITQGGLAGRLRAATAQPATAGASASPASGTANGGLWGSSQQLADDNQEPYDQDQIEPSPATGGGNDSYGSDNFSPDSPASPEQGPPPEEPGGNRFKAFFARIAIFFKGLSRKQWLIIGGVCLILIAGVTTFILTRPDKPVQTATVKKQTKKAAAPTKPTSPLTGLETTTEDTKRPIIGVMVENSTFARPQSGLKDAGVVFEAIAEYGITRFLALYQEANPGNVGPVRSARPYYVDWARSYDAGYGHVGGSPDALNKIKADGVRDLDQFANGNSYHRISQREAPHNVYTSMQTLRDLMSSKGNNSSTFAAWPRKKEAAAKAPTATAISIGISGPTYDVRYDYDAASNSYHRTMGGSPHSDADSGARIAPKVVIGLATQYGLMADGYHSTYATTGSGTAKIFQDGTAVEATWKREGNETYKFYDATNKEIKFNPGQTWITVVGDPAAVTSTGPAPAAATPAP